MINPLTTDQQTAIYLATTHFQCECISILSHKQIKNMNERFRVHNNSALLNRVLEFPITLVLYGLKHVLSMFWMSINCKNGVAQYIVNVTRLYVIDDVMKIKLATEWHHASPCQVSAVIYQPINQAPR